MRSAGKISDLPNAWIKKKKKGIKGVSCWGQPFSMGGLEHLQQNSGKGSREGMGWRRGRVPEPSIALTGKRGLEAMEKLCLGLGR